MGRNEMREQDCIPEKQGFYVVIMHATSNFIDENLRGQPVDGIERFYSNFSDLEQREEIIRTNGRTIILELSVLPVEESKFITAQEGEVDPEVRLLSHIAYGLESRENKETFEFESVRFTGSNIALGPFELTLFHHRSSCSLCREPYKESDLIPTIFLNESNGKYKIQVNKYRSLDLNLQSECVPLESTRFGPLMIQEPKTQEPKRLITSIMNKINESNFVGGEEEGYDECPVCQCKYDEKDKMPVQSTQCTHSICNDCRHKLSSDRKSDLRYIVKWHNPNKKIYVLPQDEESFSEPPAESMSTENLRVQKEMKNGCLRCIACRKENKVNEDVNYAPIQNKKSIFSIFLCNKKKTKHNQNQPTRI